jgi:hypothetical protein
MQRKGTMMTLTTDDVLRTVWELSGQTSDQVAGVPSDEVLRAALPFPVEVVPSALVR